MVPKQEENELNCFGTYLLGGIAMIIAKTNPLETLSEHTNELLKRYEKLYKEYGVFIKKPEVWNLLKIALLYHDTGKAYSYFQYTIRKSLGEPVEKTDFPHIPHGYLSPFFLPLKSLKLDKKLRRILMEAIAYHHERDVSINPEQLLKVAKEDLLKKFELVHQELNIETPLNDQFFFKVVSDLSRERMKSIRMDDDYLTYVLVKGLLHRLDHAASAHIEIEVDPQFDLSQLAHDYIQNISRNEKGYLRPLQMFTYQNQCKNIILTAQTGMGKTEAALLWAGKKKTFFTVPLRVSLNALYDRVSSEMGYQNCGLLHSTSAHHLDEKGIENWEVIYDQSKHLSNKLIFTTIDQILKFPFKFRGYEKYYATLAYSCVIIDEIQAYSPWIVAVIIKAIEMIQKIGGRFMIMTATLPKIYLDVLYKKNIIDENCLVETFYDDSIVRHRLELKNTSIHDSLEEILEMGREKKVLVITNTVDEATTLYKELKGKIDPVYLFHARFIQKDRQLIEAKLKEFDRDKNSKGIWITTQIVEASIDIDFDFLYTEIAPLDSLFQRFGRCYRKRILKHDEPNVFIYTENVSGNGSVYDKEIIEISKSLLQNHIKQEGKLIYESQKMKLVEKLYSKETIASTKFYQDFINALKQLDYMEDYQVTHSEAQKILRGDESIQVIPREIFDQIIPLFEQLELETDSIKRTEIRREIERYTCSVNKRMFKNYLETIDYYRKTKSGTYPLMNYVYILDKKYDFDEERLQGVGIEKEDSSFEEL